MFIVTVLQSRGSVEQVIFAVVFIDGINDPQDFAIILLYPTAFKNSLQSEMLAQ